MAVGLQPSWTRRWTSLAWPREAASERGSGWAVGTGRRDEEGTERRGVDEGPYE